MELCAPIDVFVYFNFVYTLFDICNMFALPKGLGFDLPFHVHLSPRLCQSAKPLDTSHAGHERRRELFMGPGEVP